VPLRDVVDFVGWVKVPIWTNLLGYERNWQRNIDVIGVQSEVFQWSILYIVCVQ